MLLCCAVLNSVFGILCSICCIFTLCGKLCSAAWSSYLQEKSFYSESKSNLSEWWQEKQWVQSIASLSLPFPYGEWFIVCPDSLCFSIKKLWIENWHWLFTMLQGLDPLGFSSLLQLNTSAFKKLFWFWSRDVISFYSSECFFPLAAMWKSPQGPRLFKCSARKAISRS